MTSNTYSLLVRLDMAGTAQGQGRPRGKLDGLG